MKMGASILKEYQLVIYQWKGYLSNFKTVLKYIYSSIENCENNGKRE